MSNPERSLIRRYGAAVLSVLAAAGVRGLLVPVLGSAVGLAGFLGSVLFSSWYGGFGPALAAGALSTVCILPVLLPGAGASGWEYPISTALCLLAGVIIVLFESLIAARRRAETEALAAFHQQQELEREVVRRKHSDQVRSQLAALVQSTDDAIIGTNLDLAIVSWNASAERLFGYKEEEVRSRPLALLLPPEAKDRMPELLDRLKRGEPIEHFETIHLRKGGGRVDVSISLSATRDADGVLIGAAVVIHDITARKRAEMQVRESETRYRRIVETAHEGIWMTDAGRRTTYVNRRMAELLGYAPEEMLGRPLVDFMFESERSACRPKLESPEVGLRQQVDFRLRCKDGSELWTVYSSNPIHDTQGNYVGVLGMFTPINERKRMEEELRRRSEQLQEADRRKDEFLAMLAHELRNPLAPIRNALHIMKQPGINSHTIEQVQSMMERQVQHMSRLVDDLLDISRITRGKIELRKQIVELATLVQRTVETSRPLIEERRHALRVRLSDASLRLEADPTRLEQVVSNLLNNAAKYTEPGGRIDLEAGREGDQVVIRVRDNGIGIAPEMLPRVFDLFVQVDDRPNRAHGGLGIGLTLARRLIELHGGSLHALSAGLGQGSEFIIRLPAYSIQTVRVERRQALATPVDIAAAPRRLLVVDDNADAAESLALMLQLSGHEVRVAHDGPSALAAVSDSAPDLVLLDLGMPGMDGYEVARRLRSQPDLKGMRLIALTGWGQEEDRRRSREAGFNAHLVKPIEPEALYQLIGSLQT